MLELRNLKMLTKLVTKTVHKNDLNGSLEMKQRPKLFSLKNQFNFANNYTVFEANRSIDAVKFMFIYFDSFYF